MAITRSFKETIQNRAIHDAAFRENLLKESIECMLSGDTDTGKAILRNYIKATIGFEELGEVTKKSPKSLMRMFSPSGNPTAKNLFGIIRALRDREGVAFEVRTVH